MMHSHRSRASAHGVSAESRLAFRRGNFNYPQQQPQYQPQYQQQPQYRAPENSYHYQVDTRLSKYAKGCKDVFLNRMNKIGAHIAAKGDAVKVEQKNRYKELDAYFKGDFKKWIERYEQRIENNAAVLEENLKKCETVIDNLEKKLYDQTDMPEGKVFSERLQGNMEEYYLKNGIAVESTTLGGEYVIDVPKAWKVEFVNATPKTTLAISASRTRFHFQPQSNAMVKITIGDVTIESVLQAGGVINLKSYTDIVESRRKEAEEAAKRQAEEDARSAIDVTTEKIDTAIEEQESHRTLRMGEGEQKKPVGPLNQIPSSSAQKEVDAIKDVKAELEAQKGNIPEQEYNERKTDLEMREHDASRKQLTLMVQEAMRLARADKPEAAQKILDEVAGRFQDVYGVYEPATADRFFQEDNISQLYAEDGYVDQTLEKGKNIDGGKRTPRAKGEQPYKMVYEGKGKLRLVRERNYDEKFNEKVKARNAKLALHEISQALSKALGVTITEQETSAALTAINIATAMRDQHDNAVYIHSGDNKLYQSDFGVDTDLESGKARTFRAMLEKEPAEALRRLAELPATTDGAKKVKTEAAAALARYEQGRELTYDELERGLAEVKKEADALRALQLTKNTARSPEEAQRVLNSIMQKMGLNQQRVNKDGDAKYGPDISWFSDRINTALGDSFKFLDGTERKAVYNKDTHSIVLQTRNAPAPAKVAPKKAPTQAGTFHDMVMDVAGMNNPTIDMDRMNKTVDKSIERSLEPTDEQRIASALRVAENENIEDALWVDNKTLHMTLKTPKPTPDFYKLLDETFFKLPNGRNYRLLQVDGRPNEWDAKL